MHTVETLKPLFDRLKPGYWVITDGKGKERKGWSNLEMEIGEDKKVKNKPSPEAQYADFVSMTELLPDGTYIIFFKSSKTSSEGNAPYPFRIGEYVQGVGGVGNEKSPQAAQNASFHQPRMNDQLGIIQIILQQNQNSNQMMMQMMSENTKVVMEMMKAQGQFDVYKVQNEQNKTVTDRVFGIAEKHLPSVLGFFKETPQLPAQPVAVGRAEAGANQVVPPPKTEKQVEKPVEKEVPKADVPEKPQDEPKKDMNARANQIFQRVHALKGDVHPVETVEKILDAIEKNPDMLNYFK